MSSPTVRPMCKTDIVEAAALHRAAFPSFFLSELGAPFLKEFYRAFLRPGAVAWVARAASGEMLGVVVGHTEPEGFFKKLLVRRWWAFAVASVPLLFRRPRAATRLLRALAYRGQTGQDICGALLSSICVVDEARGTGTGRLLIDAWTADLAARGGVLAHLTTDAEANEAVNAFYIKSGWKLDGSYVTPEGRRMNRYTWNDGAA